MRHKWTNLQCKQTVSMHSVATKTQIEKFYLKALPDIFPSMFVATQVLSKHLHKKALPDIQVFVYLFVCL
jgi:hypothetical protein